MFNTPSSAQSFKIILDETTNKITSTIITAGEGGLNATRGVENQTGIAGVSASCNTAGLGRRRHVADVHADLGRHPAFGDPHGHRRARPRAACSRGRSTASRKSAPVVLVASLDPGPLNLGPLGILNVGLTPGLYAVIADGAGALGPPNPADFTDWYCGD